ncbi:hypothetical protein TNIN_271291 [Trichonephila inaurata madagascariensis]|uniref:Uncharacterized protein n=1 Tax=Trichonephila inaurata madagascariensis TaxID=2747483 RepID=A0A8X6MDU4_9ARAC|nr:hypothetical protein TNIN_271291 [Trichonephila inaurata madagascariensis]
MELLLRVSLFLNCVFLLCGQSSFDGANQPPEEEEEYVRPTTSTAAPTEPPHIFCPVNRLFTYPCTCEKGSTEGLTVHCENANLAMMSLGLGNIKDKLIYSLLMTKNYVRRLKGSIFHNITIVNLEVSYNKIEDIEPDVFDTLGESLYLLAWKATTLRTYHLPLINSRNFNF